MDPLDNTNSIFSAGYNANIQCSTVATLQDALWTAAARGKTRVVAELLATPQWQQRVNQPQGKDQWTALMTSAWHGHAQCVEELLRVPQAHVNQCSSYDMTALHMAAMNNHAHVV